MSKYDSYFGQPVQAESKYDSYFGSPVSSDRPSIEAQTEESFTPQGVRDLTRDDVFNRYSGYMDSHFGMNEDDYTRQEIADSYVNHMRKFNFGQSVTTLEELAYINKVKGLNDERLKAKQLAEARAAYDTFDSMKGAFADGTTAWEKLDAVGDYGRALIVDPVNLVGLGVGKLVSGGATKAAAQAAKYAVRKEAQNVIKTRGITEGARSQVKQLERVAANEIIKKGTFKTAGKEITTKQIARKEALGVGVVDAVAGVGMDAVYQNIMDDVDLQDGYNMMQGSIALAGGALGMGLGYSFARGFQMDEADVSTLGAIKFFQAQDQLANARKIAGDTGQTIKDLDMPGFEASLPGFRDMVETLKDKAARGQPLRMEADKGYLPDELAWQEAFFAGISNALADNGVKYWSKRGPQDGFLNWMSDLMKAMPDNVKDQLSDIYDDTLGANVEIYKGKKLFGNADGKSALDMVASEVSDGAKLLNFTSQASKVFNKLKELKPDADADDIIEEFIQVEAGAPARVAINKIKSGADYMQRNLIRMLVTHMGTTALNLIGWQTASTMQSLGDIVRGTLYGGASVINAAVLNKETAGKFAKKAGLMLSLQKQKMRNLLDPNMTYESFMDFLAFNPAAQKDMLRYMAGGVDIEQMSRDLQLEEFAEIAKDALGKDAIKDVSRNKLDKIMDKIQVVYGVKLQDMATKSQEFMYAIDKQMRLKYDMTYVDFLNDPSMWKRMMGDDYAEIVSTASQDALRNVFSKSYADSKTPVGTIAGFIESLSRQPIIGAMVPFGQFFNNTMAHIMDHTGISLAHKYWAGTTRDPMELLTKTAVGLTSIGVLSQYEKENLDAGLAWYEERASDGSIRNRLYDFPYIFYKAIGRMGAHIEKDGTVPRELFDEVVLTFGPGALTRQLDDNMKGMYDIISDAVTAEDPEYGQAVVKVIQNTTAMYASGYTRFLDPVNLTASMMKGEAYVAPDRKQGAAWVNNSVRYSDELLESIGAYVKPEKKYQSITTEADQVPIGKVFGVRFSPATSSAERAFNEAGIADWKTNIRTSIPEARNDMNRIIAPILEYEFGLLLEKSKWKSGNPEERKQYIYDTINTSKQYVKEILANSFDPEDTRSLLLYKLGAGEYANKRRIQDYQKNFGLGDEELTDLELPQLQLFVGYVEVMEDIRKDKREE
jgi:hypothetical protein